MKVFYSWQSDEKYNKNYISESLKNVVKSLKKDTSFDIIIDQATRDEPGAPNISETIFKKIDDCNIFIADVTLVNEKSSKRRSPNPNVLIELGYAIKKLGFSKIVLLFNSFYGTANDLPFDIRQNRILQYEYDGKDKSDHKNFENAIKLAILTIDKRVINSDKIELVFFDGNNEDGSYITIAAKKQIAINKQTFLNSIKNIPHIDKSNISSWQEHLLKIINTDKSRKEALKRFSPGHVYVEAVSIFQHENRNFFEEYQNVALFRQCNTVPISFILKNSNQKSFENIKIIFSIDKEIQIIRKCDMPDYPQESNLPSVFLSRAMKHTSQYDYSVNNKKIFFEITKELLRIGEKWILDEPLYLEKKGYDNPIKIEYQVLFMDMPQLNGELMIEMNYEEAYVEPMSLFTLE